MNPLRIFLRRVKRAAENVYRTMSIIDVSCFPKNMELFKVTC